MPRKVKYIGPGWLPGVPAQDHTAETAKRADALVKSGLYEYADETTEAEPEGNAADSDEEVN